MIQIIPYDKINQKKWDACIKSSEEGNIFGLYDSVSTACKKWSGVVLDDYEAVMVLPIKKKLALSYSWHPQFMGPLGIYGGSALNHKEMINQLSSLSWWIKMYYWQEVKVKNFKTKQRVFQQLNFDGRDIAEIRTQYNDNTKRNIRKAEKNGLVVKRIVDVNQVIKVFKENKGETIGNIDEDSYKLLKKLMNHWMQRGNAYMSAVYHGKTLMAIGYFLKWKDTVIYYKGSVTEEGKLLGAMHWLMDAEISSSLKHASYFDFGGSNVASVARFYKGFGGEDQTYYEYEFKKFKIL